MATRWEYWTGILDARMQRKTKDNYTAPTARYSPQHLIPQLNALGEEGWELVHMEPVYTGKNEDILMHDSSMRNWTSAYFCVLKRPREF